MDLGSGFAARARYGRAFHVVELSGELDLAARAGAVRACAPPGRLDVLVDLSGLTFLDCAGYRALVAATSILERRGGSLVLMNPIGEPRRLLGLIEVMSGGLCAPLRYGEPCVSAGR